MVEFMVTSESNQVVQAVKKVLPAVVSITMTKYLEVFESPSFLLPFGEEFFGPPKRKKVKIGGGSGFFVDDNGIILTNRHVIEDPMAEYVVVLQNREKLKPEILACDAINDIAILKVKKTGLPTIKLGDSSKLELGETVIAIGNALGLFRNTVSTGVVSGLSREIRAQSADNQESTRLRGLIQTDAAINPGNSGGPLVNIQGIAVGINAAMVFGAENIGFALPINNAKKKLAELKKYGRLRQPFLGVRYLPITKELQKQFNLPVNFGALVIAEPDISQGTSWAVVPGSPADRAGLKEADIITEISGRKITPEVSINDILSDFSVGQKLVCNILRQGREKIVDITLDEKSL